MVIDAGGKVLARSVSGVLIAIRKRLLLVPPTQWVSDLVFRDTLRATGLSPARFDELRSNPRMRAPEETRSGLATG